nr:MAG TPA: hypothetical protein [Caudoviricetes sp.]
MVRSPTISQVVTVQKLKKNIIRAEIARLHILLDGYRVKKRSLKNLKLEQRSHDCTSFLDGYRVKKLN